MFGLDNDQIARLVFLVALLAFLLGGMGLRRGQGGAGLRHLAVWVLIVLGLVTLYTYRAPLLRFAAPVLQELAPGRFVEVTNSQGAQELVIRRDPNGHFQLVANANEVSVRFLVDTGASSTVLTYADAGRSGIDTDALEFNRPVQTANGIAFSARATLRSLKIGPFRLSDLPVAVMPAESLNISLLGMSTINRFGSWRIEGDRMVLVP